MKNACKADICRADIGTMGRALRNREISAVELCKLFLERIEKQNPLINAFITVTEDAALKMAAVADCELLSGIDRGPLHGIPYAVKDLFFTKGILTTMGAEIYSTYHPNYNAAAVDRMNEAGAVLLGKLNTHQFAYGSTGDRSYYGPVHNPHDLRRISGGSSSGSAAAVAAHLCPVALGTDTGGSIRMPSSICGTVGMKPTFGRVSKHGVFNHCESMDHIGPITNFVTDNALVLNALAGYDQRDPFSIQTPAGTDFTDGIEQPLNGFKVGLPDPSYYEGADPGVLSCFNAVISRLKELGATIINLQMPMTKALIDAFNVKLRAEAYSGHRQRLIDYPIGWDEEIRGRVLSGADLKAYEFVEAERVRRQSTALYRQMLQQVDVIVGPTLPVPPTLINQRQINVNGENRHVFMVLNRFTGPISLMGLPCLSLPCGKTEGNLPVGLQIMSDIDSEQKIYHCARALEKSGVYESELD